jgi:hypothetical protein
VTDEPTITCPAHHGTWGADPDCDGCTLEDGTPRPVDPDTYLRDEIGTILGRYDEEEVSARDAVAAIAAVLADYEDDALSRATPVIS